MKPGYSYNTVAGNVNALQAQGETLQSAVGKAYNAARRYYFRKFPNGALPAWLAHPSTHRVAQYYLPNGAPIRKNPVARKRSANASTKEVGQAARLFQNFTGRAPGAVRKITFPAPPKAALVFGTLVEVTYQSERDGNLYSHTFRKSSRPLVLASHDGKQVQIVGGRFAFTERGIVDK